MAVMLSLTMILSMGFTTSAKGTGSLTVKIANGSNQQSLNKQTIKLYRLFDITSADAEDLKDPANYEVNSKYTDILKGALELTEQNDTKIFEALSKMEDHGIGINVFAEKFTQLALAQKIEADVTKKITEDVTEVTFDSLPIGYYLVYQTGTKKLQSSLVTIANPNGETIVYLKGDAPDVEKTVEEDTAEVGKVVKYEVKTELPDTTGYEGYTFRIHDTLTDGLDFSDETGKVTTGAGIQYQMNVRIDGTDINQMMDANFEGDTYRSITLDLSEFVRSHQEHKGKNIIITYYAKVNTNAVIKNYNKAFVKYGNDPDNTTDSTPDVVVVNTYELKIKKIDPDGNLLEGATFALYRTEEEANANNTDNAIRVSGGNGSYVVDPSGTNYEMVSETADLGGYNLVVRGLDAGTYYLVETKAPEGYARGDGFIPVTIVKVDDDTFTINDKDGNGYIIEVINNIGSLLPGTGGMGTMIFTAIGVVLILGVAGSFVISRRKKSEE